MILRRDPPPASAVRTPTVSGRWHSDTLVEAVLASRAMDALRLTLDRAGLKVDPDPVLFKFVSESLWRVMFPVVGGPVQDGAVVSVVCLHDVRTGETLYAHPMHAGPEVNPLLKHLGGPMAFPKAQQGADGDRATLRLMEHKRALWDRFGRERSVLGDSEAARRWRSGYYWALKRLYFCTRCTPCKWGDPVFDGPHPAAASKDTVSPERGPAAPVAEPWVQTVADVLQSDIWQVECNYARRGGFSVRKTPRLVKHLDNDHAELVFATNALLIQAGALVAVAATYHRPSRRVLFAHCLCAGPDPEIPFLKGDLVLGLPQPQSGVACEAARASYASWRRSAWSRFWLDDLEKGLEVASEHWLGGFWPALERLFGGNDLHRDR